MNTRYPIVLVHGLAMKDTFFMKSWGRIDRLLRIQGYTVYKSDVDGFGTVAGELSLPAFADLPAFLREHERELWGNSQCAME